MSPRIRRLIAPASVLLVLLAPALALIVIDRPADALFVLVGAGSSVGAGLASGWRPVALASLAAIPTVTIAGTIGDEPAIAAAVMAALGLAAGLASMRGAHGAGGMLAIATSVALGQNWEPGRAVEAALFVAAGGLYGAFVTDRVRRRLTIPAPPTLTPRGALQLGLILGGIAGLMAAIVLGLKVQHGYWALMTLFVAVRPSWDEAVSVARLRVIGTLAGGLLGSLAAGVLSGPALLAVLTVGLLYLGVIVGPANYALSTAFTTMAIVLVAGSPADADATALTRAAMIVLGAVGVVTAAWASRRIYGEEAAAAEPAEAQV